jgi:hypothetical protein
MSDNPQNSAKNGPSHFIVLDAIARGLKEIDKISKATRLSMEEVENIVNDLSVQRLATREQKKRRFFGGSRVEIKVTETGLRLLNSKKLELQHQAEQLKQWNKNGNTAQIQSYMNSNNRSWVPFMLFSGIMDILFFTSMMSVMGLALNPAENQMTADSGGGGTEAESTADNSGGESDTGGGGDFGGFDGGGFGDF